MCGPNEQEYHRKRERERVEAYEFMKRKQAEADEARRACEPKPEGKLASLMYRELQVSVSQRELRLFIKAHWSKISALAHQIHDEE